MRRKYTPYVLDIKHRTTNASADLAAMRRTALRLKGKTQADLMEKLAFDFATDEMMAQFGPSETYVGTNKKQYSRYDRQIDLPILALRSFTQSPHCDWGRRVRFCVKVAINELEEAARLIDHWGIGDAIDWRTVSARVSESYEWQEGFRPTKPYHPAVCTAYRLAVETPIPENVWLRPDEYINIETIQHNQ